MLFFYLSLKFYEYNHIKIILIIYVFIYYIKIVYIDLFEYIFCSAIFLKIICPLYKIKQTIYQWKG